MLKLQCCNNIGAFSMKRTLILAAALACVGSLSFAADLPVKSPVVVNNPCTPASASTPLSCSGWYVGAALAGSGSNADIIGSGINGSVFAGGMVPSIAGGYQYVKGDWLFGAELDLGYAVNSNVPVGNFNGFRATQFFKAGGNLAGLFGGQSPVTIPASLANSVLGAYIGVGVTEWHLPNSTWATGQVSGAGFLFDISPKLFGDVRYTYTNFDNARASGLVTLKNDQSVRVGINYKIN